MTPLSEFKKPFNFITLGLTIFSIFLSFYFYNKSVRQKKLSYSVVEPTSLIFDSRNSMSALKLYEKDSIIIKENVYLLNGTIWNSGDFPIMKSDLRLPLVIALSPSNRILDFKITKQYDKYIAKFELQKITNNLVNISWNYFDPNFGFNFQIIYTGSSSPEFSLQGKILDIPNFSKYNMPEEVDPVVKWTILIFMFLLFLNGLYQSYKERKHPLIQVRFLSLLLALTPLIALIYFSLKYFNQSYPKF